MWDRTRSFINENFKPKITSTDISYNISDAGLLE